MKKATSKPKKPAKDTGIYIDDYETRLHIYMDDSPKQIAALIVYLEKLLKYKEEQ